MPAKDSFRFDKLSKSNKRNLTKKASEKLIESKTRRRKNAARGISENIEEIRSK